MLPRRIEINASSQLVIISFPYFYIYTGVQKFCQVQLKFFFFCDVGKDSEQNQIMIGFRLSTYASGSTAVGPIYDLCHIPENMKIAVKVNFNCQFFSDIADGDGLKI